MSLYLIRHGSTAYDLPGGEVYQGSNPAGLDSKGIDQAQMSGKILSDKGISAIWHDGSPRCEQTAEIIRDTLPKRCQIYTNRSLRPWENGLEGQFEDEAGITLNYLINHPYERARDDKQSWKEYLDRVSPAIQRLKEEAQESNVAAVVHSHIFQALPYMANGSRGYGSRGTGRVPAPGAIYKL